MKCEYCERLRSNDDDPTALCMRHLGIQEGWKCASCGSPWIYLIADGSHYDDGEERRLCKPCTKMLINAKGLNKDVDE